MQNVSPMAWRRLFAMLLMYWAWSGADTLAVQIPQFQSPAAYWLVKSKGGPKINLKTAPVIVWLHGGMGSTNCAKGLTAGLALQDSALKVNALVASPSVCGENNWLHAGTSVIDALLDSIAKRRGAPIDSIWMVGVSDGGLGVVAYNVQGRRSVARSVLVSTFPGMVADEIELAKMPGVRKGRWIFLQGGADRLYPLEQTMPWMQSFCAQLPRKQCEIHQEAAGEHDWSWWMQNRVALLRSALH